MNFIFDPSLVLYLPLYELDGASFVSRDAYGHLCTATGALWRQHGRAFDGADDFLDIGNPTAIQYNGTGLTIEVWMRSTNTAAAIRRLVSYDTPGNPRYLLFKDTNGHAGIFMSDGSVSRSFGGTTRIDDGNWYHIVFVDDGSSGRILVNTIEEGSNSNVLSSFSAAGMYIGAYSYGTPSGFFPGDITEVRIYNRALTPPEIQHNYLATKWRYR